MGTACQTTIAKVVCSAHSVEPLHGGDRSKSIRDLRNPGRADLSLPRGELACRRSQLKNSMIETQSGAPVTHCPEDVCWEGEQGLRAQAISKLGF